MLKKYPKFNLLFATIFILQLVAEFNQLHTLRLIVKPLIVISLLIMFCLSTGGLKGRFHKRLFAGLFFALAGDVFLMFNNLNTSFFMYGLIAFLTCHICYTSAFYLDFRSAPELDKKGARIAIALCFIFSISFYFFLRPYLGIMRVPVLAYTIIISLMMMMAAFRNMRVNKESFQLIFTGAIFFLLSDSILAYNKFVTELPHAGVLIMGTYMIAQYLITIGGIERQLIHRD
ncbi:lysoplasmalogenase [Pedobacter frigoris]|uniref:Lysoplasmalogenase n=1 Tax=Pedobacter frigoris TaxID=2571272 RepID=A0A4V5NZR1_9SPHI|nr:lysoplasmalogenase [Pedobacter frigoris]TKC09502.1 lysoplasmalogenase [Pedobacter frigoris]